MVENMRIEDAEFPRQREQAICEECGEENLRVFMEFSTDNNKLICIDCYFCEPYYQCYNCKKLYSCEITRGCIFEGEEEDEFCCETCIIETNRFEICNCKICKDIESEQISSK